MNARFFAPALAALALLVAGPTLVSRGAPAEDLDRVMQRIKAKAAAGKTSEGDLAGELNQLSDLQTRYRSQKSVAAEMLFARAMVYGEVINDREMARILLDQVRYEYPGTPAAAMAEAALSGPPPRANATAGGGGSSGSRNAGSNSRPSSSSSPSRNASASKLSVGDMFPDFAVRDLDGGPLTIAQFRGKVVLIDFWATWCGPCVQEMPAVMAAYRKHHDKGFEIIGISADRDRAPLVNFVRDRGITWPQHFDANGSLARRYGIESIPSTFLLDGEGKIVGMNLRGAALERAVARHTSK